MIKPSEKSIILPVTLGSMFEWFDIFLMIYWPQILTKSFSDWSLPMGDLIYTLFILAAGFIARPLGGILFGFIGDTWGRKTAFLISIVSMVLPSVSVIFMHSFSSWALDTLIFLGIIRFLKAIPAGGELPAAWCLLYEGASPERRRYVSSYLFVGPQIGQTLSMLLVYSLVKFLSQEQLASWGWRLSFLIGGIIAFSGFLLRRRLEESTSFEELKIKNKIEPKPLKQSIKYHKKNMLTALFLSVFEVVGYFMIYVFLFGSSTNILHIHPSNTLFVYSLYMIVLIFLIPLFGFIGNQFPKIPYFKISAWGVIAVSYPFYLSIEKGSEIWVFLILNILILLFTVQFSLMPSLVASLFPTAIRFTCIGISFNLADGVIGGMIPIISSRMIQSTGKPGMFILLFPIFALLFLIFLNVAKKSSIKTQKLLE
jgi:MFS transporter, MHS family, proline/betaine transporter